MAGAETNVVDIRTRRPAGVGTEPAPEAVKEGVDAGGASAADAIDASGGSAPAPPAPAAPPVREEGAAVSAASGAQTKPPRRNRENRRKKRRAHLEVLGAELWKLPREVEIEDIRSRERRVLPFVKWTSDLGFVAHWRGAGGLQDVYFSANSGCGRDEVRYFQITAAGAATLGMTFDRPSAFVRKWFDGLQCAHAIGKGWPVPPEPERKPRKSKKAKRKP